MDILKTAARIELLILDVDGVLTDGGLYYSADGCAMKKFYAPDGLGVLLAHQAGLKIGVITGRSDSQVDRRMEDLRIDLYKAGVLRKLNDVQEMTRDAGLSLDQVAYLGDDWVDLAPMLKVGLPMAVCNALPEVKEAAAWVSSSPGGAGAVREAIMFLLRARGQSRELLEDWMK